MARPIFETYDTERCHFCGKEIPSLDAEIVRSPDDKQYPACSECVAKRLDEGTIYEEDVE